MTLPTPEQCRYLENLTEPYCPFQREAIPGDVARPMIRMHWLDWHHPVVGAPQHTITEEGRRALHAAKALRNGQ